MIIRLFMNDYIDVYIKENGKVYVEIGKIDENGNAVSENMYANSSFETFMKYLGIYVSDLNKEIEKYLSGNELFLRIKSDKESNITYNLHDVSTKEELVSYETFEDLTNVEILQIQNSEY